MKKTITITVLISLLALVLFGWLIREGINLNKQHENLKKLKELKQANLDEKRHYEISIAEFLIGYDGLFKHYQKFLYQHRQLLTKKELKDEITGHWEVYEITAYTSNECGTATSTGIDLRSRYANYLNVAAVDPEVVPYGSILLIKFEDGQIKPFVAMDCGELIKGKKIDLYFTDVNKALEFGRQKLRVAVIN